MDANIVVIKPVLQFVRGQRVAEMRGVEKVNLGLSGHLPRVVPEQSACKPDLA